MWTESNIGIAHLTSVKLFVGSLIVSCVVCQVKGTDNNKAVNSAILRQLNFSISYGFGATKIFLTSTNATHAATPVVLNRTGDEIRIECKAPYPIDLTFDGHRTNREFDTTIRRTDKYFSLVATTPANVEATGNYSCFPTGKPEERSSFYIYVAVKIPSILLNWGQTIVVRPNCGQKKILIPCPISNPIYRSSIKLCKKAEGKDLENESVVDWDCLDSMPYDPALGFFLRNYPSSPGTYNCSSSLNPADQVIVIVQPNDVFRVTPDQERWTFKENETFKGKCESSTNIVINSKNIPLKSFTNKSVSTDTITSYALEFETEALNKSNHNHQITCEGVDSDSPTTKIRTWTLQLKTGSQGSQGRHSLVIDTCHRLYHGIVKFYECNSWIECQMRRCQKFDHQCDSDNEVRNAPDGILQCMSNLTDPKTMIYFKGLSSNNTITEWKTSPKNDILTLKMEVADAKNSKEILHASPSIGSVPKALKFVCEGSRFVFAPDFLWKMTVKPTNGSDVISTDIPAENITHVFSRHSKSVISSEYTLVHFPKDFVEISCEARIWNSTGSEMIKLIREEVLFQNQVKTKAASSTSCRLIAESLIFSGLVILTFLKIVVNTH